MKKDREFNFRRFIPLLRIMIELLVIFIAVKLGIFLFPFVFALIVVSFTRPLHKKIMNKFNIKSSVANNILITLIYLIITSIAVGTIYLIVRELYDILMYLINNRQLFSDQLNDQVYFGLENYVSVEILGYIEEIIVRVTSNLFKSGSEILNYIVGIVYNLPAFLIYTIITVSCTYLIANDIENVNNFFKQQFPENWLNKFEVVKTDVINTAIQYFKSQIILIMICFTELLIGFNIINLTISPIKYIFLISMGIAFVDALPIVGTNVVLIPWMIYEIAKGNLALAAGIFVLYVLTAVSRFVLTPHILTNILKINPVLSLLGIYVGFKLFGILGFLVGPMLVTVATIVFEEEIKRGFFKIIAGEDMDKEDNEKDNIVTI